MMNLVPTVLILFTLLPVDGWGTEQLAQAKGESTPIELGLSPEELDWIKKHPSITVGVDPNWAPFEYIDDDKKYSGMAADYIRLVAKKVGMNIVVQDNRTWAEVIDSAKKRELDVLPAVMRSDHRDTFLDFTRPHISYPMVIVTNKDSRFISGLDGLRGEKVVVVDDYVTEDILRQNHPELRLLTAKNIEDAVDMVSSGEAFAFVDNLASITETILRRGVTNLRISGTTQYEFSLAVAVPKGNDILLGIIQKGLDALTEEEINEITNRWISVNYIQTVDYTVIIQIVVAATLLIIFVLVWNRRLSREVTSRKLAEERLRQSERRFRMLFEDNNAVELILDPITGKIIEANRAALEFYGYSYDEICNMTIDQINMLSSEEIRKKFDKVVQGSQAHFQFKHKLASGEIRDVEVHSGPIQWHGKQVIHSIIHDVTQQKQIQERLARKTEKLSYQAAHDPLTGLINRRELGRRIKSIITNCARKKTHCEHTLMFMDLDGFKVVNDTAGHAAGDDVLREVSVALKSKVRDRDTLARLGGDEFGLLLESCSIDDAMKIADGLIQGIKDHPFPWNDFDFSIGLSIGITEIRQEDRALEDILRRADTACYTAKKNGRNRYQIFDEHEE